MNGILLLILYFYWIRKSIFDAANKTKIIIERHLNEEFSLCFVGAGFMIACQPLSRPEISGTLTGIESDTVIGTIFSCK